MSAPEAALRFTTKVRVPSTMALPMTGTLMVLLAWPAVKVRSPLVAV